MRSYLALEAGVECLKILEANSPESLRRVFVINSRSFADQHVSRVKKFVNSFMISQNDKIRFIGQMAMLYSCGPLGRNVTRIGNLDNVILNVDGDLYCNAKAISDLIDVRDGLKYLPELDRDDVELLIEDLCCN